MPGHSHCETNESAPAFIAFTIEDHLAPTRALGFILATKRVVADGQRAING